MVRMVGIVSVVEAVGIWIASRGWWAGLKRKDWRRVKEIYSNIPEVRS